MKEKEKRSKKTRSYVITSVMLLITAGLCFYVEKPFSAEDAKGIVMGFCNTFTVPGVLFAGFAILTYLASLGAYDSLGYTFSNFGLHNLWFSKQPKKYKSLYDYKQKKNEKGRAWWPQGLFVGLASLAVSGILLIVYLIL